MLAFTLKVKPGNDLFRSLGDNGELVSDYICSISHCYILQFFEYMKPFKLWVGISKGSTALVQNDLIIYDLTNIFIPNLSKRTNQLTGLIKG